MSLNDADELQDATLSRLRNKDGVAIGLETKLMLRHFKGWQEVTSRGCE